MPADRLVVGDLRDVDHLDHLLVVNRIEAVVHFAAHCYVGESVTDPAKYYTNNLVNTLNLLDRCRRNGVGKFVFSSTCATYGVPTAVPITEDEQQVADQPLREHQARRRAGTLPTTPGAYPFGFCALRYFNAAGAGGGRHHRRGPRPRNAPDPARPPGRARPAPARRDLRHRLPDARRHLRPRLHPRR